MTLRSKLIRLANEKPELRPYILPLLKEGAVEKAKVGDLIQSAHDIGGDLRLGSIIGTVTKVDRDDMEGIEYVYYTPIVEIRRDGEAKKVRQGGMRVPQNGIPTSMGRVTNAIRVIG